MAIVIATGTNTLSLLGPRANTLFQLCTNIDHSLLTLFLWIILIDLSSHLSSGPYQVFALGWLLRSAPFWALGCCTNLFHFELTAEMCSIITYLTVVVLTLVLVGNNTSSKKLLARLHGRVEGDAKTIEQRCRILSNMHSLTPRETDVLVMLSRGQTRPYIAQTLDLSENTVRGYTKSLYKKLGIHDRQSLFKLVEGFPPDSGGR